MLFIARTGQEPCRHSAYAVSQRDKAERVAEFLSLTAGVERVVKAAPPVR
jgi:hypothetical protein